MSPKAKTVWRCQECGTTALQWYGRCPDCGLYGTLAEEIEQTDHFASTRPHVQPVAVADAGSSADERFHVGIEELDRVLGGGLVNGSLVLLGGEPGIGKSTLLLQASHAVGADLPVLYVCGEESSAQVSSRARRLGLSCDGVSLLPEIDVAAIEAAVTERRPGLLVIDSVQTAFDPELSGAPGSVGQVRAVTARLMRIAKDMGVTTLVAGHVTKDGAIAGPRVLEHMVDAVLYFEGDKEHAFRVVRAVKNRYGPASEIGVFEMTDSGLKGVGNPSALFLDERAEARPGSVVMPATEGSRSLLVEVQALVTPSYLQMPRRLATGVEGGRLLQVIAVLEGRSQISFAGHDVYVAVAGGVRVTEPAVDLPLALALVSARIDRMVPSGMAAFGEVDLTGRVRAVSHAEPRLRELTRHGFERVIAAVPQGVTVPPGLAIDRISCVSEIISSMSW